MNSHIKLTGRECTITLSDQNLQTVIAYDLIESIKNAVYGLDGIDTIMFYNNTFIVDILDPDLDVKQIYTKIIKVIAGYKPTAKTQGV